MAAEISAQKIMQRTQLTFGYSFQRTAQVSFYWLEIVKTINVIIHVSKSTMIHQVTNKLSRHI